MNTLTIIKELCEKNGISIAQLEKTLQFGNGSISKANAIRSDRLLAIAQYFKVPMEYLMGVDSKYDGYYFDEESAEYAEFLHKNPNYKVLFDASRKVKPEDIDFVRQMIERTSSND